MKAHHRQMLRALELFAKEPIEATGAWTRIPVAALQSLQANKFPLPPRHHAPFEQHAKVALRDAYLQAIGAVQVYPAVHGDPARIRFERALEATFEQLFGEKIHASANRVDSGRWLGHEPSTVTERKWPSWMSPDFYALEVLRSCICWPVIAERLGLSRAALERHRRGRDPVPPEVLHAVRRLVVETCLEGFQEQQRRYFEHAVSVGEGAIVSELRFLQSALKTITRGQLGLEDVGGQAVDDVMRRCGW